MSASLKLAGIKRGLKLSVLALVRALGGFALARRLTRDQARILCYHGFAYRDEHRFVPQLFMHPDTFRQRVQQILASGFTVVSLAELVHRLERQESLRNVLVITVDDGWTGFARFAWPLLQQQQWPCTLYLTTWYAEKERPVLNVLRRYLRWRGVALTAEQHDNGTEYQALRVASAAATLDLSCADGELFRLSTLAQVQALARSAPALDIQLHTHRHRLPIDAALLADELTQNRARIEIATGRVAEHFCYPSGEYSADHLPLLRAFGVRSATTTRLGLVSTATDPMQLPRILDGENLHPLELAAELSGFSACLRRFWPRPKPTTYPAEPAQRAP